jgi:hypothetical protein
MSDNSTNNNVIYFDSDCPIRHNGGNEYYTIKRDDGLHVLYLGTFPIEWANSHEEGTGPNDCDNCLCFGSKDGVFLGYCANCADYIYKGIRGRGMYYNVEEFPSDKGDSIFDTYLKGIDLSFVGSEFVNLSDSEKEKYQFISMTEDDFIQDDYVKEEHQYWSDDDEEEIVQYGFTSLIGGDSVFTMDSAAGYNSY